MTWDGYPGVGDVFELPIDKTFKFDNLDMLAGIYLVERADVTGGRRYLEINGHYDYWPDGYRICARRMLQSMDGDFCRNTLVQLVIFFMDKLHSPTLLPEEIKIIGSVEVKYIPEKWEFGDYLV